MSLIMYRFFFKLLLLHPLIMINENVFSDNFLRSKLMLRIGMIIRKIVSVGIINVNGVICSSLILCLGSGDRKYFSLGGL